MRKLNIVFYLLLVAVISSCTVPTTQDIADEYEIIKIESCEYIMIYRGRQGFMAHKGKCKNCN